MTVAIVILVVLLAAVNGANDVPKGVATLAGAGVTRYRTAILWGTVITLVGSLVSLALASKMTALFSKGIVSAPPRPAFALAVLSGAAAWVLFATITRLPVSTTHAIIGALFGAGILFAASSVQFAALGTRVALPLLASIAVAYGLSWLLTLIPTRMTPECICVDPQQPVTAQITGSDTMALTTTGPAIPTVSVSAGGAAECAVHAAATRRFSLVNGMHWVTSGATSFARGLNDSPKIYAIGAFALVPLVLPRTGLLLTVAITMAVGGMVGGMRIARRLGEGVVRMSHVEGFKANLTTSLLVGVGANLG
ncbi:MAG: inorganic phosphate transporter, partial [Pseudonocardiaceae bacterium]